LHTFSDSELVRQLQHNHLDALGILYDRHQRMVFRTALAITGDPEAAADLLQDVFLRLYRFSRHVDPLRPLEPWLYRMTANLAYTWLKRHNRWMRSLEDLAEKLTGSRRQLPGTVVELDDSWQQVRQAILSLPFQQRVVVVLYYLNDLSLHEIAEILAIPEGTVKSRLHYGRQGLRHHLQEFGDQIPELRYDFT
jgi:RNA polymerase sigma-70 factor (ECF subfamily)